VDQYVFAETEIDHGVEFEFPSYFVTNTMIRVVK